MLSRIAKIALVIALTSSVSGCFFGPGWGHRGGGWHDHRYFDGGPGPGYYHR